MKPLSGLIVGILLTTTTYAQEVITRISAGEHYFYYNGEIQTAFDDATAGDTIILGGGQYTLANDVVINQRIVLIGTGARQDSSLAYGGRTVLSGTNLIDLNIASTADGTEIHGIATENFGNVQFTTPYDADNCRFVRCALVGLRLGNSNLGSLADDTRIEECIIGTLNVSRAPGTLVRNCHLGALQYAYEDSNTEVWNCILLGIPGSNAGVHYENCIFATANNLATTVAEESTYVNNLFVGNGGGFSIAFGAGATDGGNLPAETILSGPSGAFVNATSTAAYVFTDDYHVSPAYEGAGSDGTDIGIYGGQVPWKDGGLPFNPHWTELNGPGSTNNGTLQNVIIRGSAQTH